MGMTNGEKFREVFGVSQVDEGELYAFAWLPNHDAAEIPIDWWNAEYKAKDVLSKFNKIIKTITPQEPKTEVSTYIEQMQADYENRLKADLVAMLTELQLEIEESENCGKAFHLGLQMASNIIQQKINALKGVEIDKAKWNPFDSTIPLEDGHYLVKYENPKTHKLQVLIARYHMAENEDDECRFYDDSEVEITLAVTAWQPLPEPYREDDVD